MFILFVLLLSSLAPYLNSSDQTLSASLKLFRREMTSSAELIFAKKKYVAHRITHISLRTTHVVRRDAMSLRGGQDMHIEEGGGTFGGDPEESGEPSSAYIGATFKSRA